MSKDYDTAADLYGEEIRQLKADKERLREALKPFADAVFNDNGDITVSPSQARYDHFCDAYFAMRATK